MEAKKEIWREANSVAAFIEDCAEINPGWRVKFNDFYIALTSWFGLTKGDVAVPHQKMIGKMIVNLYNPGIYTKAGAKAKLWVAGIRLTERGIGHFKHGREVRAYQTKAVDLSQGDDPNHVNPWVVGDMRGCMSSEGKTTQPEEGCMEPDF
jgi:hypothetical protein